MDQFSITVKCGNFFETVKRALQTEKNLNTNQSKINKKKIDFTILNQI